MRSTLGVALLSVGLVGCAADGDTIEMLEGFEPDAPGAGQIQIVSPIVRDIAPGADVTLCTYLPPGASFDQTADVVEAIGFQSRIGSHHSVLYTVQRERDVETHECTDDDMINSRYVAGAGGGDAGGTDDEIPEGVAYRIEAGKQLMIQTHWINTTTAPIDGQAAFNLTVQPPSDEVQLAQLFTWTSTNISIPAGAQGSARTDCVMEQDMRFYLLGGHAHEHGTHVSLTHTPAGGEPNMFYDQPWEAYYTFDPPRIRHTAAGAMVVNAGDTLSIDCAYDNTTDGDLGFPTEMCTGFGFYFPGDAQMDCTDGRWPE